MSEPIDYSKLDPHGWIPKAPFVTSNPKDDAAFVGVCNDTHGLRFHRLGPESRTLLTGPEVYGYSLLAQQRVDTAHRLLLERAFARANRRPRLF